MSDSANDDREIVDAFGALIADITQAPNEADAKRLRAVTASALRAHLREKRSIKDLPRSPASLRAEAPEAVAAELAERLEAGEPADLPGEVRRLVRRGEREMLLSGSLIDGLTGLAPSERLGPFRTYGGLDIWFDVFFAARRIEVKQNGVAVPNLVLSSARPPRITASKITIDIEPGTVWIDGSLLAGGLPASAFAGIKVSGGTLTLSQTSAFSGNVVTITAPLKGTLRLDLAPDAVTPVAGACSESNATLELPSALTFKFSSGSSTVESAAGAAEAWGQRFEFAPLSATSWTFVERLWTVVLEHTVSPTSFDADPIGDDLVHFEGTGNVVKGGLGLPVVAAADPSILGEAAHAAGWFLLVDRLTARWYEPDPRAHVLENLWCGISAFGGVIAAEQIATFTPAVTHDYRLWSLAGGTDRRLSWRQTYEQAFSLFYSCHVVNGESLMVNGGAVVALDRPVTTDGVPVATPVTSSVILLNKFNGVITGTLGATGNLQQSIQQFALRNALVWTTAPALIVVRGALSSGTRIDAGMALLFFGVFAWAPSLPDPYVANGFVQGPRDGRGVIRSILAALIAWVDPAHVTLTFHGTLAGGPALTRRQVSTGEPRPARRSDGHADVGETQVQQQQRTFDRPSAIAWEAAQKTEQHGRRERTTIATQENAKSVGMIDGFMREVIGPSPSLLLLDVSTNQDLLGVAVGQSLQSARGVVLSPGGFIVSDLAVHSQVADMNVIALPQVQWEPVRTLDADQNIMTMGWFPTPLASATDGGATRIGARSQRLMPIIPADALRGTFDAYRDGVAVGIRTTFPFGLIAGIQLQPADTPQRKADLYELTRPLFPAEQSRGGIQVTAHAEGGRPDDGGISPMFAGRMRQLLNGVDLPTGAPLGISVLGETLQPAGSVETVFNNDMAARPRVPVSRVDLSGYGGSNFSDWNNPFAAFAEAAKVQFRVMIGRTLLEVIKVNSVLHPWGIRVTRSVTIERRPGGGIIRRDSGWQAFTPGLFDYRYFDTGVGDIVVAPYAFDAGVFRGLFNVRTIRPAPGTVFSHGTAQLVPYYFDADVALEGVPGRTAAIGVLGYLQIAPNGVPAGADALQALIDAQGPIGGPIDTWMTFGGSGLPFRAQRVEVGLALDAGTPLFVATVRGVPRLPETGAWSVVTRPVASVPVDGGEAVTVAEQRGVPLIRRYPIQYPAGSDAVFTAPPLSGVAGDYRFADAADLLTPAAPVNEYGLLQSTPTHAFLFPRPFTPSVGAPTIRSGHKAALADLFARSTSKGAFPPATNTIEMAPGSLHFNVGSSGRLALSSPISIVGHPTPLQIAGTTGHGTALLYDSATLNLNLEEDRWQAEFTGLQFWSDIVGLQRLSGSEMRVVGSTEQRPQIAEIRTLLLEEIDAILQYIPIFGQRGIQGPIDLGASNATHETKLEIGFKVTIPPPEVTATFPAGSGVELTLSAAANSGFDLATGGVEVAAEFGAALEGKIPVLSVGVATVFVIIAGEVNFSITSVSGSVTEETLELMAFAGVGVEGQIGPFEAYAFLGIGFVLEYDAVSSVTKYGGLVALEAGVDLKIVEVKIRAELKGLVYDDAGTTMCDYGGSVEIEVEIFLIISISASYEVTETVAL